MTAKPTIQTKKLVRQFFQNVIFSLSRVFFLTVFTNKTLEIINGRRMKPEMTNSASFMGVVDCTSFVWSDFLDDVGSEKVDGPGIINIIVLIYIRDFFMSSEFMIKILKKKKQKK